MDSKQLEKLRSYMNLDLCYNPPLAFDIALKKGYINQEYFKQNMEYIEATNENHPKWPNCLFFKDYHTRETLRIRYDR